MNTVLEKGENTTMELFALDLGNKQVKMKSSHVTKVFPSYYVEAIFEVVLNEDYATELVSNIDGQLQLIC